MSKSKDDLAQTQIRGDKYNFDIEVKGQGHTEVMNVCETLYPMVIHSCDKYALTMSKEKKAVAQTQSHVKNPTINFTLRSKVNVVSGS